MFDIIIKEILEQAHQLMSEGEVPNQSFALLKVTLDRKCCISFNEWGDATIFPDRYSLHYFTLKFNEPDNLWEVSSPT